MRVMVVDGGARGQAFAHKLAEEGVPVVVSPGNPGNESIAESTGVQPTDIRGQLDAADKYGVGLTIVGSDDALANGIVDAFEADDRRIFGPTKEQSRIEWDRVYAKQLGRRLGVPTGRYVDFNDRHEALAAADSIEDWPVFVKDNALAQGKGATRCDDISQYRSVVSELQRIVVEDYVTGPEASHHAFCDGKTHISIPFLARDHKQRDANDSGPMTGGMGVVGPLTNYNQREVAPLGEIFVQPIVEHTGFTGILFSGLKGVKSSEKNLEWNARAGDPETQVFMRLLQSSLLDIVMACVEGELASLTQPIWYQDRSVVSLVLAAPGYPDDPQKGMAIEGIEQATRHGVRILHAATKQQGRALVTNGGRVLNVVAEAPDMADALVAAYAAAEEIAFNGAPPLIRTDIGTTALRGI